MFHWLRRLVGRIPNVDPVWKPTGYTYRHTGHDESKAVIAAERAKELADRQRRLAIRRAGFKPVTRETDLRAVGGGARRERD